MKNLSNNLKLKKLLIPEQMFGEIHSATEALFFGKLWNTIRLSFGNWQWFNAQKQVLYTNISNSALAKACFTSVTTIKRMLKTSLFQKYFQISRHGLKRQISLTSAGYSLYNIIADNIPIMQELLSRRAKFHLNCLIPYTTDLFNGLLTDLQKYEKEHFGKVLTFFDDEKCQLVVLDENDVVLPNSYLMQVKDVPQMDNKISILATNQNNQNIQTPKTPKTNSSNQPKHNQNAQALLITSQKAQPSLVEAQNKPTKVQIEPRKVQNEPRKEKESNNINNIQSSSYIITTTSSPNNHFQHFLQRVKTQFNFIPTLLQAIQTIGKHNISIWYHLIHVLLKTKKQYGLELDDPQTQQRFAHYLQQLTPWTQETDVQTWQKTNATKWQQLLADDYTSSATQHHSSQCPKHRIKEDIPFWMKSDYHSIAPTQEQINTWQAQANQLLARLNARTNCLN